MKKLALDPETLRVDSFAVLPEEAREARGTVEGLSFPSRFDCPSRGQDTCYTCAYTTCVLTQC